MDECRDLNVCLKFQGMRHLATLCPSPLKDKQPPHCQFINVTKQRLLSPREETNRQSQTSRQQACKFKLSLHLILDVIMEKQELHKAIIIRVLSGVTTTANLQSALSKVTSLHFRFLAPFRGNSYLLSYDNEVVAKKDLESRRTLAIVYKEHLPNLPCSLVI